MDSTTARGWRAIAASIAWPWILCVVVPLIIMFARGIDANWDLRNYHLYNPFAWWTGRMTLDVAPAQLQTWHNPLLDLPFYLLVNSQLSLRWAAAWLTVPTMVSMACLLRLHRSVSPSPPTWIAQGVVVALALTGAAGWSSLANSMDDSFVAAAVLVALTLVLAMPGPALRHWFAAGVVMGAMAGLKLTASAFCIAFAIVALVGPGWTDRVRRVVALGLGGVAGFLVTYAAWGWRMFKMFGNPVFPYYNNIFHGPLLGPYDFADGRFRAHGLDLLLIPFQMLRLSVDQSELYLRDPRLLLVLVGSLALLWLPARLRAELLPEGVRALVTRLRMLAVFVFAAYLAWALQYGYYRYALSLEMLGGLVLVLLLQRIRPTIAAQVALLASLALVNQVTTRPDWGVARSDAPRFGIGSAPLPADAMVLIAESEPIGYLALGLSPTTPLVAVSNSILPPNECNALQRLASNRMAMHQGSFWLLAGGSQQADQGARLVARQYGLEPAGDCRVYDNSIEPARLCPLHKVHPATICMEAPAHLEAELVGTPDCNAPMPATLRWDVPGSNPGADEIEIWVANTGVAPTLFAHQARRGDIATGPWNVPGTRYELRDGASGKALAATVIPGAACGR